MSKHTPGEWLLIRSGMRDNSAIATEEPRPETMEEPNYWTVAQVNTFREEWAANARLISAAPDLLDALIGLLPVTFTGNPTRREEVEHWQSEKELGNGQAESVLAAFAAIAKATGNQP